MKTVTVFGSSRPAAGSDAYETARRLGAALARAGFIVASGGYGGVMEGVSRGAREAGGKTIGVTAAVFRSQANAWVEEEIRVATWHERLLKLVEAVPASELRANPILRAATVEEAVAHLRQRLGEKA